VQLTNGIAKNMKRKIKVEKNMTATPCKFFTVYCTLGCNFINSLVLTPDIYENKIRCFMKNCKLTELKD